MANIRKTFNFRNGVQVDDDNLIVNPLGLVGIGTTIPTEALDVRGTVKVVGLITATEIITSNLTASNTNITTLTLGKSIVGGGVSISSGVITATTTSGLVTYFGDGRFLQGLPTSQWLDVNVGLGFTSIYAQGFVGVGTVDPRFVFQVAGTPDTSLVGFTSGVGITSEGNILATGIVTAYQFSGIGSNLTQLNASNIQYGTIGLDRIPTLRTNQLPNNINASGIITALGGFIGTVRGDIYGNGIGIYTGSFFGNLVGIATTATDLTSDARVSIDSVICGFSTVLTRLDVIGSVGIGTTVIPSPSNLYVKKSGISSVQIISDTLESYITLSKGNDQTSRAGSILYGSTNGSHPYSNNTRSLDIINYDLGYVNSYLHAGSLTGINTGSFNWIYGKDSTNPLMSLTYQGNLGLGNTNPSIKLDVVGSAAISSNLNVIENVSIGQSLTVSSLYVTNLANIPTLAGGSLDNFNITSGISTINNLRATGVVSLIGSNKIGINTEDPKASIQIGLDSSPLCLFNNAIGIGTTVPATNIGLDARSSVAVFSGIGIGTTNPYAYADFSNAGRGLMSGAGRFLRLPVLTQSERLAVDVGTGPVDKSGGLIYNQTSLEFQGFDGFSWVNLGITTSVINSTEVKVGTGVTINSGIVTATNGFSSGTGGAVQISVSGSVLTFNVPGVGTTSLTLY